MAIVKRPSGKYAIVYRAPSGKQVWETVGTRKREAEELLAERLQEIRRGTWCPPKERRAANARRVVDDRPVTLAEYAQRWLERQDPGEAPATLGDGRFARRRIARSTFNTYKGDLERHVLPELGARTLGELTGEHVDELIAKLERAGRAPETIRNVVIPLRRMLGEAVRQGLLQANPAASCNLPPRQDFAGKEIPPEHCAAIRFALVELAPRDRLRPDAFDLLHVHAFDVALGTGVRLGELRALQWRDVDRERRLLRVSRAFSREELTRPKSEAGVRSVPLFRPVEAALDALAGRALERGRYAPTSFVFAGPGGRPPSRTFNRAMWRAALERAQLAGEGYRWHDLRHTCVSRLVAAGADPALVQAIAGHADPRMTLGRYTHLRDARVTDAAERFADVFEVAP